MKKYILIYIVLFLAVASSSFAQEPITKMQSLYMYNFIKNIKWKNVESKYVIGVFANDGIVKDINTTIGTRQFNGKSIEVKKISSAAEAGDCQIVFVAGSHQSTINQLNNPSILKNTLLVSEEGGISNGVSIAFILENSKLKFKINEPVCKSSGLQVNAILLSLGQ